MISTRTYGRIDYIVAALTGAAAASGLPAEVRRVLGAAGAYHAGYSALTDYEAGLYPALTMRQHLALDAIGAGSLCAAAFLLRTRSPASRAMLLALGFAEFAVIAASAPAPGEAGATLPVTYPPLDTPKLVAPDLFIVDSALPGLLGRVTAARMAVIRLPNEDLVLHSPTRFSHRLKHELERRGRIRHLVAPTFAHWTFLPEWQRHCPEAKIWAAPGLRDRRQVRRRGVRLDADLPGDAATEWGEAIRLITVPGSLGFHEVALFHTPTRTLILTDLVQSHEPRRLPALARPVARLLSITTPGGTPPYLRLVLRGRRKAAREAALALLALEPERVIFAHGTWFATDGTRALRRALAWLVDEAGHAGPA